MAPVTLDGSTLEGGGQLTRMALTLSAITNTPIRIHSIRAGRASRLRPSRGKDKGRSKTATQRGIEGGLKESHLAALHWLAVQSEADVSGDEVGSREVTFRPGKLRGRMSAVKKVGNSDIIELQKPGSVGLVFQAIYPYMVFGTPRHLQSNPSTTNHSQPKELYNLTLKGGTNVPKSMSVDYIQHVFLPIITRIGLPGFSIQVHRRGWAGDASSSQIGELSITMPATYSRSNIDTTWRQAIKIGTGFTHPAFTLTRPRGSITTITAHIIANTTTTIDKISRFLTDKIHPFLTTPSNGFTTNARLVFATTEESHSDRHTYILLTAHSTNYYILGRDVLSTGAKVRGENDENRMLDGMCGRVVTELMSEIRTGNCVDEFMADQLVVFQALAVGRSVVDGGNTYVDGVDGGSQRSVRERTVDRDHDNDDNGNDDDDDFIDRDETANTTKSQSLPTTAKPQTPYSKQSLIDTNNTKNLSTTNKGDKSGTLHTQTVRWVCEQILLLPPKSNNLNLNNLNINNTLHSNSTHTANDETDTDTDIDIDDETSNTTDQDKDGMYGTNTTRKKQQLRFESGGVCHGISWNAVD